MFKNKDVALCKVVWNSSLEVFSSETCPVQFSLWLKDRRSYQLAKLI